MTEMIEEERFLQPLDGLGFITLGHYGSTVFDPMDGSTWEIIVCDPCLKALEYRKDYILEKTALSFEKKY